MEDYVRLKKLSWNSDEISDEFDNKVTENLFVKQDIGNMDVKHNDDSENYGELDFDLLNGADFTPEGNEDINSIHSTQNIKEDVDDSYDTVDFMYDNIYVDPLHEENMSEMKEEQLPKKRKRGKYKKR